MKIGTRVVLTVVTVATLTLNTFAQDYERFAPKPVPPVEAPASEDSDDRAEVIGDSTVLVDSLKGIIIRDSSAAIIPGGLSYEGIKPSDNDLTQTDEFAEILKPYLGQPVSLLSLNKMSRDIIVYFQDNGVPVVDVGVPQQDITSGVVQVVIVEGKVGDVSVDGARYFSEGRIIGMSRLGRGDRINTEVLLKDVEWMNKNPFRSVRPVFKPGDAQGETDVVLSVNDRFPVRVYAGYEDSGNDLTGDERFLFGFNWGDAFFIDHQLNYQYATSSNFDDVAAHTVSYIAPLPWRHTLSAFASFAESGTEVGAFSINGDSAQAGVRYTIPLVEISKLEHEFYIGADWKQSQNALEFGAIPISATTTDIGQFLLGYRGGIKDNYGFTSYQMEWVHSPGQMFGHQDSAAYNAVRAGSDEVYSYAELSLTRNTRLPYNFSLVNEFTYQFTDKNLLASEQMSFGGYNSIRGYDERELNNTDEGWILRNELRLPPFSPLRLMGLNVNDKLQFLGFWDYGEAWASRGLVTRIDGFATEDVAMSGIGPGLRYRVNTYLSIRADYGFQLIDTGNTRNASRWHLGATVSY